MVTLINRSKVRTTTRNKMHRLYLEKGANEDNIFIDAPHLPMHQYDGIRFLYRQFKKSKAGVILNDPSGYGKRTQAALFISAMRPVLTLPILILCNEGMEQSWLTLFKKLTNMAADVTIHKCGEIVRPVCVIGFPSHSYVLSRREWSILVVDNISLSNGVLRSGLNAKYKIWITSVDMKKSLQTFTLIHNWFYPKDRFVVEDFQVVNKSPTDLLMKSVKLDAFMADIVLRRKDVQLPLGEACLVTQPATVTRKNKDASGTKIKRSKHTDTEHTSKSQKTNIEPQENVLPVRQSQNGQLGSESAMNKNKKHSIANVNIMDKKDIKNHADISNNELSSHIKDKHKEQDNLNEIKIEPIVKDDEQVQNVRAMECDSFNDNYKLLYNSDTINSQNITIKYDSDTPDIHNEITNDNIPTVEAIKPNELNYNNKVLSEDVFSTDTLSDNKVKNNDDDVKSDVEIAELKTNDTSHNHSSHNNALSRDISSNEVKEIETKNEETVLKNQSASNKVKDEVVATKTDDVILDGIELRLKQMEELAMKKFKGSFLDNIF